MIENNKCGTELREVSPRETTLNRDELQTELIVKEEAVEHDHDTFKMLAKITLICMIFMLIELAGGIWSDSVAVISDALHLSVDVVGYIIQMMSAYMAQKSKSI